jgi:hypothetical protein
MKLITEIHEQDIQFVTEAKEDGGKNYFIEGVFMQGNIKNRNGRDISNGNSHERSSSLQQRIC